MKRTLLFFAVAVLVFGGAYRAHAIHETQVYDAKFAPVGADAEKLYRFITLPKSYTARFKLWPGKGKLHAGKEPHSPFLTTYVDDSAFASMNKKEMPEGACIISEEYDASKKLKSLNVMYKVKGYNPAAGDWFWVKYDALNGYVKESGKLESCIACHAGKKDNDYLFSTEAGAKGKK